MGLIVDGPLRQWLDSFCVKYGVRHSFNSLLIARAIMIASGHTPPGATNWQVYAGPPNSIYVDVDTSAIGFTSVPNYVASLGGAQQHWQAIGATSIYSATQTGFRVYVRFADGSALTPAIANNYFWNVIWIGVTQ